ncbi:MAG: elongation factor P [Proteobacteria bacterium]|jgi:elongation factor P|nr:elongation factor P [Pseudomonadota bacterium]
MYQTTDFRKGLKIEIEGKPYLIVEFQHVNPGKGSAFVRTRLKNLETNQVTERTFKAGVETVDKPDMEEREMEFNYSDMDGFNFMEQSTFEMIHLSNDQVGDNKNYLQEGIKVFVLYFNARPIAIELPNFVNLKVVSTDPGLKGDTASGGSKKAILETGLQVNVPLFIKEGEVLKIDTRTGEYIERAKV